MFSRTIRRRSRHRRRFPPAARAAILVSLGMVLAAGVITVVAFTGVADRVVPGARPATTAAAPATTPALSPSAGIEPVPPAPKTEFGPGSYVVGQDVLAGKYRSDAPLSGQACRWARFRGSAGETPARVADQSVLSGPIVFSLRDGDLVNTDGCEEWKRVP